MPTPTWPCFNASTDTVSSGPFSLQYVFHFESMQGFAFFSEALNPVLGHVVLRLNIVQLCAVRA